MERVEDSKENLKNLSESSDREGEDSKEPGESKEKHYSSDIDHQTSNFFVADWLLQSSCRVSCMTNHHYNDTNKDEYVEQYDDEDWPEKSSLEGSDVIQETAIIV